MTNWRYYFDVNKYVREGEEATEVIPKILGELKDKPLFAYGRGAILIRRLEQVKTNEAFDRVWNEIYDFADRSLIWLGV